VLWTLLNSREFMFNRKAVWGSSHERTSDSSIAAATGEAVRSPEA
jgi:hypothetical protein